MLHNVGLANRASAGVIAQKIGKSDTHFTVSVSGTTWIIDIKKSDELSTEIKNQCFEIFESNMKQIYMNSSNGYKSKTKKRELFHKDSRFLIVSTAPKKEEESGEATAPKTLKRLTKVEGYLMWRFDFEETLNSGDQVEVAYCYEIQIINQHIGKGLGKTLMEILHQIGSSWSMKKIMLTVQSENTKALKFYESLHFLPDEISPCQNEENVTTSDYKILSKSI